MWFTLTNQAPVLDAGGSGTRSLPHPVTSLERGKKIHTHVHRLENARRETVQRGRPSAFRPSVSDRIRVVGVLNICADQEPGCEQRNVPSAPQRAQEAVLGKYMSKETLLDWYTGPFKQSQTTQPK